jgi:hypothetical protein
VSRWPAVRQARSTTTGGRNLTINLRYSARIAG